eukprot:gi/632955233/ref/XP_007893367.1/ PREDICTED: cadherin-related family member 3-like [Callorhinchus milii]
MRYRLSVHIIDDNVNNSKPRTGSVLIDITVIQTQTPPPPTTAFYNRKGLTIVNKEVNTYNGADWYVALVFTLLAILVAGCLALIFHLIWKYTKCRESCQKSCARQPKPQQAKKVKIYTPEPKKTKVDVITEVTKYNTVFNGEAKDPVSGKWYEYNSETGARKWKGTNDPKEMKADEMALNELSTNTATETPQSVQPSPLKENEYSTV